jgi:hypothetical protein
MGAILHSQKMRRQFGLVEQSTKGFTTDDRNWLWSQGIDRPETLPRNPLWYRPDGSSSIAPRDPYHLGLYRQRGMTLKAPVFIVQDSKPRRVPVPSIAKQVMFLRGQEKRYTLSADSPLHVVVRLPTASHSQGCQKGDYKYAIHHLRLRLVPIQLI